MSILPLLISFHLQCFAFLTCFSFKDRCFYFSANLQARGPPLIVRTRLIIVEFSQRWGFFFEVSPWWQVNTYWTVRTIKLRHAVSFQLILEYIFFCEFQRQRNWLLFYTHTEQSSVIHHAALTRASRQPVSAVTASGGLQNKREPKFLHITRQLGGNATTWRGSSGNLQRRLWRPLLYLCGISAACLILFYSLQTFVDRARPGYVL